MGSITLTNIAQYIEQPGRNITTAVGELDKMTVPFMGPCYAAVPFAENTPDSIYPLMFCTGWSERANGGLKELTVNYAGSALLGGKIPCLTEPITIESPVQGSRDFQEFWSQSIPITSTSASPGPGGTEIVTTNTFYLHNYGTRSLAIRYIGTQCTVHYFAYPRPTELNFSTLGLSRVQMKVLSQTYGGFQVAGTMVELSVVQQAQQAVPAVPALFAANLGFEIRQIGRWYECNEIYGPTF